MMRSLQSQSVISRTSETSSDPSFHSVGYAGPTKTGNEPALVQTAPHLPLQTAQPIISAHPSGTKKPHGKEKEFNILQSWGQLSPWYSVPSHGLDEAESVEPRGCKIVGMHWLQRHGARYPTSDFEGELSGVLPFAVAFPRSVLMR